MRVVIFGGGTLGRTIADRLLMRDELRMMFRTSQYQISFVDEDETRCRQLEQRYNALVYQGDGTKTEMLRHIGRENMDVLIAAGEDDGKNVIAALQAKRLGVKRVMVVVQDPDYYELLQAEGMTAVSVPWATATMVENHLDRPGVADLVELGNGTVNLISLSVPESAVVVGCQIRAIEMPHECVVAAVIRGDKFVVPRGDTVIEEGDQIVFVGPTPATMGARQAFTRTQ